MNILIVEDSATLRSHMKKLIAQLGHTPLFANSGEVALQMIGSADFDLVIMDIEMPGLDGFETTRLMREALGDHWVPIIFSTGHDSDQKVLAGIEAGGDDYIVKPVSRDLLKAKLMSMQRIAEMHQQMTQLNYKLSALSQYDSLTQLFNRRAFAEKAEQCVSDTRRFGKSCAVLMIDIDYFKPYNDHFGHQQGDECLKTIAQLLRDTVSRDSDLVARYGGEEFVILLTDTDLPGAMLVAQKLLAAVDNANIFHPQSRVAEFVTLSIGIDISSSNNRSTLDALISVADKNLYQAKEKGRHQIVANSDSDKTLLIIDSCEDTLAILTTYLQPLGNIITTFSIHECIELAKSIVPDIIITGKTEETTSQLNILNQHLANHVRTARIPILNLEEVSPAIIDQAREMMT